MSQKPEQISEPSYLYPVLNVVTQLCQETLSMWDTSSHLAKVAQLESMAHLIAVATAALEENSEQLK